MDTEKNAIRASLAVIFVGIMCLFTLTLKAGQMMDEEPRVVPQQTSQAPSCDLDSCKAWAHDSCTTVFMVWFDGTRCGAVCATNPFYLFGRRGSLSVKCQ